MKEEKRKKEESKEIKMVGRRGTEGERKKEIN